MQQRLAERFCRFDWYNYEVLNLKIVLTLRYILFLCIIYFGALEVLRRMKSVNRILGGRADA